MTTEEDAINNQNDNGTQTNTTDSNTIAVDNQYFYEDLVYKINDKKKVCFGMVIDNYEDNESDSDQDEFDSPPLSKGSVKVSWYPHGFEQVVKERMVGLADRSLMPGDVVRRLTPTKPSDSQHGYCREITVFADVQQVKTKNVLPSVPNSRLIPLDRYELDLVACLGPWVGSVKEHRVQLTVAMMSCNPLSPVASVIGRFELTHSNICNLKPTEKRRWAITSYGACEHFIGQILTVKPCELKNVRWLSGSKEIQSSKKRHHLIIEDLKTVAVGVRWHCQGLTENSNATVPPQPDYMLTGDCLKDLKMLNVFETCTSQIGDRHYLTVNENDVFESKSKWIRRQSKKFLRKENSTSLDNNINLKPPEATLDELITESICQDLIDDEEWSTEESDSSSVTNSGSSGRVTPTPLHGTLNHGKKSPVLATKVLKKKMKKERKLRPPSKAVTADTEPPKPGHPILVETLCTSSVATVVWQDGTIEKNIPSTHLYPIHHLDDQEFFPGDFVIKSNSLASECQDLRDYGVVQYMNHAARTAVVKWFRTYAAISNANCETSCPSTHGQTEVSVYDLKDHPDFNFRPGTVVIRVAGSPNILSAAGQVLDNFPEGQILVKWVDGSQSMCWPQDLYRVGDYDSDEGELWDDDDDDDDDAVNSIEITDDASWETQSEKELPCDTEATNTDVALRYRLAANIERSCDAMARLEDMFTQNPALQGRDMMRKLLEVYKDCRYLDRLMGTTIFHEQHFTALLERAKSKDTKSSVTQRIQRHFQRLFSVEEATSPGNQPSEKIIETFSGQTDMDFEVARLQMEEKNLKTGKSENVITNTTNTAKKQAEAEEFIRDNMENWKTGSDSTIKPIAKTAEILSNIVNVQDSVKIAFKNDQKNDNTKTAVPLVQKPAETSVNIGNNPEDKTIKTLYLKDNSSNSMKVQINSPVTPTQTSSTQNSPEVIANSNACKALCALIKSRLIIAHAEVLKRLGTAEFIHALRNDSEEEANNVNETDTAEATPAEEIPSVTAASTNNEIHEIADNNEGFMVLEHAPTSHKYHLSVVQPPESQAWIRAVRKEFKLLNRALPPGIWVRGYEDRLDIISVMIRGPADTPYEDGLFLFDVQLGANYPLSPPLFHYVSYCSDRLNPNLYEDGKVCVSLLGTWSGRGSEVWGPDSTLLQVIVSIQGLILNAEPYYNEAGYERQKGSALGKENSRMYNEMATLKLVQSMTKLLQSPPEVFKNEIYAHFKNRGLALLTRLENLLIGTDEYNEMKKSCSQVNIGTSTDITKTTSSPEILDNVQHNTNCNDNKNPTENDMCTKDSKNVDINNTSNRNLEQPNHSVTPAFPLLPASKGFCLSLRTALPIYKEVLNKNGIIAMKQS